MVFKSAIILGKSLNFLCFNVQSLEQAKMLMLYVLIKAFKNYFDSKSMILTLRIMLTSPLGSLSLHEPDEVGP